ncbi:MAG: hypothetical protein M1825_003403 [Sarcosagium campestre]|nr:MAG: hypothetical protein M1825_003403 [Sarcosagium campestre]
MAQGSIGKKRAPSAKPTRSNTLGPKKGARTIAPRKINLVKQKKMTKKHSAGLTAKTERLLADKVGHLEILGGGKQRAKEGGKGKGKSKEGGR